MDSNDLLSQAFWIELRDDILYVLDKPNDEPSMDSKWNRFLKRMNFEARLEQRELQMKQIIGERKSLKLKRITTDMRQPPDIPTKPFLLMIMSCSKELQVYLTEHLRLFVNTDNEIENKIKEEYVGIIIKWIIESSIILKTRENFSVEFYIYIFELMHDRQFPRVHTTIVNALNSIFSLENIKKENVFMQDDIVVNLERIISSWFTYTEDVVIVCLLAY
ncbi:unnamed protein product, partial [Rotaria sordida]